MQRALAAAEGRTRSPSRTPPSSPRSRDATRTRSTFLRKAVAAGYCREIITRQPEFARFRDNPDFRSIVAAPQKAAGS